MIEIPDRMSKKLFLIPVLLFAMSCGTTDTDTTPPPTSSTTGSTAAEPEEGSPKAMAMQIADLVIANDNAGLTALIISQEEMTAVITNSSVTPAGKEVAIKNIPVELLDEAHALGLSGGFGDDMLRIGNVKVFMDGALGPHTAAMFQPYIGEDENRGILNMDGEELFEHGRKAAQVGLGMTVHAIGDRANHEVLNAYEHLRPYESENHLPALRHRVEHVQVIHPVDAPRLARLKVVASMQPIHATSDLLMADRYWGPER